jgi:ParB/RepB/Spo0J family partition protein
MNALTPLVIQNAEVLRRMAAGEVTTKTELGAALGRTQSNFSKTLARLTAEGWIDWPHLTPAGDAALAAVDGAPRAVAEANPVRDPIGLPHADIVPNPNQPRRKFDAEYIDGLAASIREQGLLQPLLVRPFPGEPGAPTAQAHSLVAGECRWRAIGQLITAGDWPEDQPVPVVIRAMTDAEVAVVALVENLQRQDMTYLEEAHAFQRLHVDLGFSTQEIADKVGKTQRFVQQRLQLLELTDAEKAQLDEGTLSIRQARERLANRPEPLNLTPAELLVVAEVIAAANPDGKATYWSKAGCDPAAAASPLYALLRADLVTISGPAYLDGRFYVSIANHTLFERIAAEHPGIVAADPERRQALMGVRARFANADKAEQADDTGAHLTGFLNGPFALSPEGQAIVDQREDEKRQNAVEEAEQAAAHELHARRLAKAQEQVADADALSWTPPHVFQEVLAATGSDLPWTFVEPQPGHGPGRLVDANGREVDLEMRWGGADKSLRLKMIMAAINAAAALAARVEAAGPAGAPPVPVSFRCETCGDEFESDPSDPDCATCGAPAVRVEVAADDADDVEEERECTRCSQVFDTATEESLCPACASEAQAGAQDEEDEFLSEDA